VFAIDRVVAATGPKLFLDQIVADIRRNNFKARVSEWEFTFGLGKCTPTRNHYPRERQWLPYNSSP